MTELKRSRREVVWMAAGLLFAFLSLPTRSTADTGANEETVYYGERCFNWNEEHDGYCPASDDSYSYLSASQDPSDCAIIEVYEGSRYTGTECCYSVVMEACYDNTAAGCFD